MRACRLVGAVLAAALALAGCDGAEQAGTPAAMANVEHAPAERGAAPTITGELLDGAEYDVASARGSVVVVNFWGSWCAPCRAEIGALEETYLATKAQGVTFLGINTRDDRDKARAFQAGRVTYPSLFDPAGRLALAFDVPPNTTPTTLVLDRAGRVAVVIRRAVLRAQLEPVVARIAAEPR